MIGGVKGGNQSSHPTADIPTPTPPREIQNQGLAKTPGQQKTRSANRAGFGSASGEAYLRRNLVLNFSTRPAESTKRFSPV